MAITIAIDEERVAEICRDYPIARLSIFGSALNGNFGPQSDIDVLVDFLPDARIGYFGMAEIEQRLTEVVGRQVDMRTYKELSRYFRDKVRSQAIVLYERE